MLREKGFDVDLTPMPDGSPHPFWDSSQARVTLPNHTEIFNTDIPLDLIKVRVMQGSNIVANSIEEVNNGATPDAEFYIYSEEMEMEEKAKKINTLNKARKLALEMPQKRKAWIIQIMKGQSVEGKSNEFLDVIIDSLISDDTDGFIRFAEMDKEKLFNRALVVECIHRGILVKDGPKVLFGTDTLGYDLEEAVAYIAKPANQAVKLRLMEKTGK